MGNVKVLQRIVEEGGNCSWAAPSDCDNCPLSHLKTNPKGQWMNCVEAVGVDGLSEEEADVKYKEAALRKMFDMQLEETLEEESDGPKFTG